ncbi:MAG: nucleotidyl transferase AbiEii/AbiGii toxin family protein [Acidobacteriota bacterium]
MQIYLPIFETLDVAELRWMVAGGWAVSLHGAPRMTVDLDLVVDLEPPAGQELLEAFRRLGLVPQLPVPPQNLLDASLRRRWQEERGLRAFSWYDAANPLRIVDLVLALPAPFEDLWQRRAMFSVRGRRIAAVSRKDLVAMKEQASRPRDLEDLRRLMQSRDDEPGGQRS